MGRTPNCILKQSAESKDQTFVLNKNKDKYWKNVFMTDEAFFLFLLSGKQRWATSNDTYERIKIKILERLMSWSIKLERNY